VGCIDGPVIGISNELGLEVTPGVGLAGLEITGSSTATAEAHADNTRVELKNRIKRKGSRKLSSIVYLLSSTVDVLGCLDYGLQWELTKMKGSIHDAETTNWLHFNCIKIRWAKMV
jgi:hypothetical protein